MAKFDLNCEERGFSLIELLVTIAILGIAIVPIMMSYTRTWQATISAKRLTTASMLARKNLHELQVMNTYNNIPTGNQSGNFTGTYNEYSWERDIQKLTGGGSYNIKKLQIRVTYNSMITSNRRSVSCMDVSTCNSWDYTKLISKLTP